MTENMEVLNPFDREQREHVFGDRLWLVSVVGLVAVGVPAQVGCNKGILVGQASITGRNSRWFCGHPCMQRTVGPRTCRDVVERNAIYFRPFVFKNGHCHLLSQSDRDRLGWSQGYSCCQPVDGIAVAIVSSCTSIAQDRRRRP